MSVQYTIDYEFLPTTTQQQTGTIPTPKAKPQTFRTLADRMEATIQAKEHPSVLNQRPTRRRAAMGASMQHEGQRLRAIQQILRGMANAIEAGTLAPELYGVTTRAAVEALTLCQTWPGLEYDWHQQIRETLVNMGIHTSEALGSAKAALNAFLRPDDHETVRRRQIADLERELIGRKIHGFFPTPALVVRQMLGFLTLKPGMRGLEPSAGKGDIAEALRAEGIAVECCEWNETLRGILEAKGFTLVGRDFLEHRGTYDVIAMNPPFERFQDICHVRHAYSLLALGGELVSIVGESAFFRSEQIAVEFRQWLDEQQANVIDLDAGTFHMSGTGVKARIIYITK